VSISLSTGELDFGGAPDNGSVTPDRTVTVTNLSPVPAVLSPPTDVEGANASNYIVINDTCGASLAPAPAACHYTVEFTANALGAFDADLLIKVVGDPSSPFDVPLIGTGTFP
jgi:hypothetical protein